MSESNLEKVIKETVIKMFEDGELQIEVEIDDYMHGKEHTITKIYHYPDDNFYNKREINRFLNLG